MWLDRPTPMLKETERKVNRIINGKYGVKDMFVRPKGVELWVWQSFYVELIVIGYLAVKVVV